MLHRFTGRSSLARLGRRVHHLPSTSPVHVPVPADSHLPKPRPRGGQNLSARWQRLESSLREKGAQVQTIDSLPASATSLEFVSGAGDLPVSPKISKPDVETFRGFIVPKAPQEPGPEDCCMSGCAICVHDLYAEAVKAYRGSLQELRSSLRGAGIPETEWPSKVLVDNEIAAPSSENVTLNAFEEMERALAAKKVAQSQSAV